jgi:hypothetical protein
VCSKCDLRNGLHYCSASNELSGAIPGELGLLRSLNDMTLCMFFQLCMFDVEARPNHPISSDILLSVWGPIIHCTQLPIY